MIKINLATKKQIAFASAESKGVSAPSSGDMKELVLRMFLPLAMMVAVSYGSDYYFEKRRNDFKLQLNAMQVEKTKIENQLKKFSGFEMQKAELEKTANLINIKISTIEKLIRGKDATFKSLLALSQSLPKDLWLTDFVASPEDYLIRGSTSDISLVSDLMSKLGSSIYFKDVTLRSSQTDQGGKLSNFELTARRQ